MENFKEPLYKYNQTIVKKLGDGEKAKLKITTMNVLRTSGLDVPNDKKAVRCSANDKKLSNNITRARTHIYELAVCNPWEYFATFTIDSKKFDREDLEKYHKSFVIFLRNYNKKHNIKISFLLIPELHFDGKSWHMHGLLNGLPKEHLHQFAIGDTMGKQVAEKVKNGETVFKWQAYENKFGWCVLEPIKNQEAVCKYIVKYINKDLERSVTGLNAHLYYHSRGLKEAKTLLRGTLGIQLNYDYQGEYCSVLTLPFSEEYLNYIGMNIY